MNTFDIDRRNAKKRKKNDQLATTLSRIKGLSFGNTVVQRTNVEKRVKNSGQKRWYQFAYWQELMGDVFNIYSNH